MRHAADAFIDAADYADVCAAAFHDIIDYCFAVLLFSFSMPRFLFFHFFFDVSRMPR